MLTILIVILVLMLLGALPNWQHSRRLGLLPERRPGGRGADPGRPAADRAAVTLGRSLKTRLAVVAALLATLFVGRLWGGAGRWELDRALQAAAVRGDLLEAHAALLGARVSLCNADFGDVSQRLDDAQVFVGRAGTRLGDAGVMMNSCGWISPASEPTSTTRGSWRPGSRKARTALRAFRVPCCR